MADSPDADGGACLVTGGAGFIGSHLAEALLAAGRRVVVLDDLSSGRLDNISRLQGDQRFRLVKADAAELAAVEAAAAGCRVIFHLAAVVGVRAAVETPVRAIRSNIACCEAALEAARRLGCRLVLASSSEVYGRGRGMPLREEDGASPGSPETPRWSYAAGKLACEYMAMAYFRQYGVEVSIARLFNVIGPRQSGRYGMVVPRFVRQALRGEPLTVFGDGSQRRCFCDVRDAIRALIGMAESPAAAGGIYNVGGTEEISILELAGRIKELARSRSDIALIPYAEVYGEAFEDVPRRVPDISRIGRLLGWRPEIPLDETLAATVEFERSTAGA